MQLFYYYISVANLKMYFRLSWKTWKALFIELVSFFYCIYFLLLLVIWLSVEKMFSTKPIIAFLDLCSCYIFWLHLWVNKNVDGCLKYVYNMIISIYRSIYSCIELNRIVSYNFLRYRQISYCWVWESISYRIMTNHPIYTNRSYNNTFCAQRKQNNDFMQQLFSSSFRMLWLATIVENIMTHASASHHVNNACTCSM